MIYELNERPTLAPNTVCAVRLLSAYENYAAYPFARFWHDEEGRFASLMDGVAVFCADTVNDEWLTFWSMQPNLSALITDETIGDQLAIHLHRTPHRVDAMKCVLPNLSGQAEFVSSKEVYPLLKSVFGDAIPAFDEWYADVSHRTRHAGCRTVGVVQGDGCVSSAMTVAECTGGALIGAVATAPQARRQGLAARLVGGLANALMSEHKHVFICPKHEAARRLYERIGFEVCGGVITLK